MKIEDIEKLEDSGLDFSENTQLEKKKKKKKKINNEQEETQKFLSLFDEENEDRIYEGNNISFKANKSNTVKSCYKRMIDIIFGLLPFKSEINFIKGNYNGTIIILFEIIRFLFLMSLFGAIIFLFLLIYHVIKLKKGTITDRCKYYIFCFLFYSSFTEEEFNKYSITMGVWVLFFFIFSLMFYFILKSGFYQTNIYNRTNKKSLLTSYIFNSWDFNIRKEKDALMLRNKIQNDSLDYTHVSINYINYNDSDCDCDCTLNKYVALAISSILSLAFIIGYFTYLTVCFKIRNIIRDDYKIKNKLYFLTDIMGDFVCYLLIATGMHIFPFIVGLTTKIETWTKLSKYVFSETLKKTITSILGFIYLIFIFLFFTIQEHSEKDFILNIFSLSEPTFFGCPGKYKNLLPKTLSQTGLIGYTKIKENNYSKCREEEVGINFLLLTLLYLIVSLLIRILNCIINCCFSCKCLKKRQRLTYQPFIILLHIYSVAILFGVTIPFIPYIVILFPIIMYIEFKSQYSKLINNGRYNYDATNVGTISNSQLMLTTFCCYNILTLILYSYFYIIQMPHKNEVGCYNNGIKTILVYENNFCGPASDNSRLSYGMSYKILNFPVFGFFFALLREGALFFMLIAIILIVLIFRKNSPNENYFEDIVKREQLILSNFQLLYEQITKKNVINALLLKIVKKKHH